MPSEADRLLVELALKNHLVNAEEAKAALAEATPQKDAGAVLLAKGIVKQQHLDSLKKKVAKMLEAGTKPQAAPEAAPDDRTSYHAGPVGTSEVTQITTADGSNIGPRSSLDLSKASLVLFGQIAIHEGLVTEADLKVALDRQAELERNGVKRRIGEIFVDKKKLTGELVQKVLSYQEKFIFACAPCATRWNVAGSTDRSALRCPTCGGALQPGSGVSIGVQGSVARAAPPGVQQSIPSQVSASGTRRAPTDQDPAGLLGLVWKGYKIEKVLGRGGMGAVYVATQVSLNRKVAFKVMLRGAQAKSEELARFVREYKRALAQLSHQNILRCIDAEADKQADLAWFTMELVKGRSFKEALTSGKFPIDRGARVVAKCARAMAHAHAKGIIHRDLKPQNVMLDEENPDRPEPKILDFGLAKTIDENTMNQLTQMGAFLGTPAYMAPEQAGGDPSQIDGRADVYSLGAMLYEVLTGRPPFTGGSPLVVIKKVLGEAPVPPTKVFPGTLAVLEPICMKCLEKDPGARPQNANELAAEIERVLGPEPEAKPGAGAPPGEKPAGGTESSSSAKKSIFGKLFGS